MIKLSDIQKLDKLSYAEVEKIVEEYEDIRMAITREINSNGGIAEYEKNLGEFYANFSNFFEEESARSKKRRAKVYSILEQIKSESAGEKND